MAPLIAVKNVACLRPEGDPIFVNVSFEVNEGDIIILRARSGTGRVVFVRTRRLMLIVVSDILIFQKDHPLEVYSPSQSLSWNCRIQGKVSHFTQAPSSQSCLTRTRLSDLPKLMVR
jgi:hypothetical protein